MRDSDAPSPPLHASSGLPAPREVAGRPRQRARKPGILSQPKMRSDPERAERRLRRFKP